MGFGTTVTSLRDGVEFPAVSAIRIGEILPGEPITAEFTIMLVGFDIAATGRFMAVDPVTGQKKAISKIVYEDGTEFVPPGA